MTVLRASLFSVLVLAAPAGRAQNPPPPPPPPQTLLCYVLPFPETASPPPVGLDFTVPVDGKPAPLSLVVGGLSAPIVRPAAADFTLYRALPPAAYSPPPGSPPPAPPTAVGRAAFPADWNPVLLLIASDPAATTVRMMPFDLGPARLPVGNLGVFNLGDRPYALGLGSERTVVDPRAFAMLNIPRRPDRTVSTHVLQIAHQDKGGWTLSGRQTLTLDASGRTFTLLLPGEAGAMPRLVHVPVPEPQPPASEAPPAR